jgi:hypothetical protein
LEDLRWENVDILYVHSVYFVDVCDILRYFGTFCGHLVHFVQLWYYASRKIWQPWSDEREKRRGGERIAEQEEKRAILNFTPDPQGLSSPLGVNLAPGWNLSPRGNVNPPLGANLAPRVKF